MEFSRKYYTEHKKVEAVICRLSDSASTNSSRLSAKLSVGKKFRSKLFLSA